MNELLAEILRTMRPGRWLCARLRGRTVTSLGESTVPAESDWAAGAAAPAIVGGVERQWWRWLLPFVIVAPMVGLGYGLGERAFVFPEGAALAVGVMVVGKQDWVRSGWRLLVLPTTCAVGGTALAYLPVPKVAGELLALGLAVALAQAVGGRLAPVVSAAVLPVVFGITTWVYPAAVAAICLVLLVMVSLPGLRPEAPGVPVVGPQPRWPWSTLVLFSIVGAGWIVLASLVLRLAPVALAPPLLVAALEWCGQGARPLRIAVRRWVLLVVAAAVGGAASSVCPPMQIGLAATQAVAASAVQMAAVAAVLVVMAWTGEYLYPALAIALVPNLIAPIVVWQYSLAIGVGAAALFVGAFILACTGRFCARRCVAMRSGCIRWRRAAVRGDRVGGHARGSATDASQIRYLVIDAQTVWR
ncbi:MAG: hypothetical protein QOE48_3972 [Mycobacterium sp.]|nr:hypothetical protein [Mycobacterium sp.]